MEEGGRERNKKELEMEIKKMRVERESDRHTDRQTQ